MHPDTDPIAHLSSEEQQAVACLTLEIIPAHQVSDLFLIDGLKIVGAAPEEFFFDRAIGFVSDIQGIFYIGPMHHLGYIEFFLFIDKKLIPGNGILISELVIRDLPGILKLGRGSDKFSLAEVQAKPCNIISLCRSRPHIYANE